MMGPDGLARATGVAVLAANYVAARLADHFPVLYAGNKGLVAHECILDLRPLTRATGVTVDDVAKRLIDYGFHAPTMSFPVAGTLMVEPTESEDLAELDRFCDAMIAIRAEIDKVAAREWPAADNPLANAPHTAEMVTADEWTARLSAIGCGVPGRPSRGQVLVAGAADRRRVRRPQPGVLVPAAGGVRRLRRSAPIGTGVAARASRRSHSVVVPAKKCVIVADVPRANRAVRGVHATISGVTRRRRAALGRGADRRNCRPA